MEEKGNKFISITLVILLGVFFQVLFVFGDMRDTPGKAVTEFAEAYFCFDDAVMTARLCEESRTADETDVVGQYVFNAHENAGALGFRLFFTEYRLSHVETYADVGNHETARVRLVAEKKQRLLRSFFTHSPPEKIEEIFTVVKEDGKWKVCGNPFSIQEG